MLRYEQLQRDLDDRIDDEDKVANLEDEAVRIGRELLSHDLAPDTLRHVQVCLAVDLVRRFRRRGTSALADLEDAIELGRARVRAGDERSWVSDRVNLASALLTSWEERERADHLQECLDLLEPALADEGVGEEGRALIAANLATVYAKRFAFRRDPADLERAIATYRIVLDTAGQDDAAGTRANLALALLDAHRNGLGPPGCLDEAVRLMADGPGAPLRARSEANWWDTLAQVRLAQFERDGVAGHLEEAGAAMARALALLPADHPGRAGYLGTAAVLDFAHFEHRGGRGRLDSAIARALEARTGAGPSPQDLAVLANQICLTVTERFDHDGNRDDLDQAVYLAREVLATGTRLDIELALRVNLAHALHRRFELTGEREDLTDGITCVLPVLAERREPSPARATALAALAGLYETKALTLWQDGRTALARSDLDQAVRYTGEALATLPDGSPDTVIHLASLANLLSSRASLTDSAEDFEAALDHYERVLERAEEGSPAHARIAYTLGNHYAARGERTGPPGHLADLQRACDLWDEALAAEQPFVSQFAGQRLGDLAFQFHLWDKCELALTHSLDAARTLTTLRPRRQDRERARLAVQGVAAMAAVAAVRAGAPERAVVHLEQGAATLLAEAAGRPAERVAFDDVVAAARELGGPLVYWAATYGGGAALIVTEDGTVTPVGLAVTTEEVDEVLDELRGVFTTDGTAGSPADPDAQLEHWNRAVGTVMAWTWRTLVADVVEVLDRAGALDGARTVGLVPVGRLAALPLTVAHDPRGRGLFERAVPCLLPNGRSIGPAEPWPSEPRAAVVCDAGEGTDHLPAVASEARRVASCYARAERHVVTSAGSARQGRALRRTKVRAEVRAEARAAGTERPAAGHPDGETARFLARLEDVDVAHLACHFTIDFEEPLASVLRFGTGIPLAGLLGRTLPSRVHVVLGVCDAALTGTRLPDEAIGPAPLLLAAGARSVLAALWPVDDETAPELMADYHRRLARGVPPATALAETQRHVRASLPLALWASFVHTGR